MVRARWSIRATRSPAAFAVFHRGHARAVLKYLRYRTQDAETAADLTAEVFVQALLSLARSRPGREPARAWLFGRVSRGLGRLVALRKGET